ncbi:MAG: transglycosylase SLT domain-containing protein [Prevotellaceae bacterium]|jgi:hypothetical protein|nr:transglycosylase SLT domain-containing protein [Prevotellaceae bacterium]
MLIYETNLHPSTRAAFVEKVKNISQKLGIDPDWLMGVMWQESRLRPNAKNSISGATGLIQFMPNTAQSLGTTTQQLAAMDAVTQLDYVYKYYTPYSGQIHSFADTYFVTFFPAAIGKPDDWVLQTGSLSAGKIAAQNNIYDVNRDGKLTVAEVKSKLPNIDALKKK